MSGQTRKIELTEKGFRLLNGELTEAQFEWIHVTEIVAYRRDPEGADLLCLGFRMSPSKEFVEVDEEIEGYSALLPAMYDALPAIDRDWWQDIAVPLGNNRQTIYGTPMSEEDEEAAADKYLRMLKLEKLAAGRFFKVALIVLGVAVIVGFACGLLYVKTHIGGNLGVAISGGIVQAMLSLAILRRIRPVLLTLMAYALAFWLTAFLCR